MSQGAFLIYNLPCLCITKKVPTIYIVETNYLLRYYRVIIALIYIVEKLIFVNF